MTTQRRVERKRRENRDSGGGLTRWAPAVAALIVGLVIGLVYGWVIDPSEPPFANPDELSPGGQRAWVAMVADSYAQTGDAAVARQRLQFFPQAELSTMLADQLSEAQQAGDLAREQRVRQLSDVISSQPIDPQAATPSTSEGGRNLLGTVLMVAGGVLGVVVLFLVVAVVATRMQQNRQPARTSSVRQRTADARASARGRVDEEEDEEEAGPPLLTMEPDEPLDDAFAVADEEVEEEEFDEFDLDSLFEETSDVVDEASGGSVRRVDFAEPEAAPVQYGPALAEFVTRYNYGDDGYDMSFPIETQQTEFLGECGVGVSDMVNEGSPQQVTAFEVWLFDKDDIRTVTRVLLSDYAWNNEALRNRLATKGELVHVKEGDTLDLETKSLRVRARVREAEYAKGGTEPRSYFERFVVELTAQRKQ